MKKVIVGFFVLLSGLSVGFSYWEGIRAEKQWRLLTDRAISSLPPGEARATYHRGWFKSSAEFRLDLPVDEEQASNKEDVTEAVVLRHTLAHGPFPLTEMMHGRAPLRPILAVVRTRITIEGRSSAKGQARQEDLPGARIDTLLELNGGGTSDIFIPPLTFKGDGKGDFLAAKGLLGTATFTKGEFLTSKELGGTVIFTSGGEQVHGEIKWGGAKLVARDVRATQGVTSYKFTYQGSMSHPGRWKDTLSVGMSRVEWGPKDNDRVTIEKLDFVRSQTTKQGNLKIRLLLKVKEASGLGLRLGPALFEFNIHRLDPSAVEEWSQLSHPANKTHKIRSVKDLTAGRNKQFDAIFSAILRKSPRIDFRMEMGTANGIIRASSNISFDGSDETYIKPELWSTKLDVDFKFSIPVALVGGDHEQLPVPGASPGTESPGSGAPAQRSLPSLGTLLALRGFNPSTGSVFLVRNGDRFESHVTCHHDHVLVNGWPLELLTQRAAQ